MSDQHPLQAADENVAPSETASTAANRIAGLQADASGQEAQVDPLDYDYTNFYFGSGDDPFALIEPFEEWWGQVHERGYYQYELPLHSAPSTQIGRAHV